MKKLFRFRSLLSKEDEADEDTNGRKEKLSRRPASSMLLHTVSSKAQLSEGITKLATQGTGKGHAVKASKARSNGTTDDEEREAVDEDFNFRNLPQQSRGEQVAAGWPEWLTIVAGEALKGWIPKRADAFQKIDRIGQGTYSNVYKARDMESGKVVALKKVRCDSLELQSVRFMAREIKILRRLGDHPNVIKLEGLATSRMSSSLYLVFEYMDNDLTGLMTSRDIPFVEAQVKCFLLQILRGLDHCHSCGVLHRDLKGSNLLLDSGGNLKIADFGLATFFKPGKKQQLTSRVVTLWYRPPELLLGAKEYGFGVDLWSVGCIFAELFTGRPILAGRTEVEQLHKIFKLCGSPSEEYWEKHNFPHAGIFKPQLPYDCSMAETFKSFPQTAVDLLTVLLSMDPELRGSVSAALKSEFLASKPFACDPSSLPKSLPRKDQIVETKDQRKRPTRRKAHQLDVSKRDGHEDKTKKGTAFQGAKDDLVACIQETRRDIKASTKRSCERFHLSVEEPAVVSPAEVQIENKGVDGIPNNGPLLDLVGAHFKIQESRIKDNAASSPIAQNMSWTSRHDLKLQGINSNHQQTADLSKLSSLVAARNNGSHDSRKDLMGPRQQVTEHYGYIKQREELQTQMQKAPRNVNASLKHRQVIPPFSFDVAKDTNEEAFHSGDINITQMRTAKSHYSGESNIQLLKT